MMAASSGKPWSSTHHQPTQIDGIVNSFKDLLNVRRHDPPTISVSDPTIRNGSHHVYKIRG